MSEKSIAAPKARRFGLLFLLGTVISFALVGIAIALSLNSDAGFVSGGSIGALSALALLCTCCAIAQIARSKRT